MLKKRRSSSLAHSKSKTKANVPSLGSPLVKLREAWALVLSETLARASDCDGVQAQRKLKIPTKLSYTNLKHVVLRHVREHTIVS